MVKKVKYSLDNPDLCTLSLKEYGKKIGYLWSDYAQFSRKYHSDDSEYVKDVKTLRTLIRCNDWSKEWINRLEGMKRYGPGFEWSTLITDAVPDDGPTRNGLLTWLYEVLPSLRKDLGLSYSLNHYPVIDATSCFDSLNYVKQIDSPYNTKETYYVKGKVLVSHATALILNERNILDHFRVYRRQNPDKTHLAQFTQLEYKKTPSTTDMVSELKNDLLHIITSLGLDADKVKFKPVRYPYVLPGYEIYYDELEIGGCGVMTPNIEKTTSLAAGLGLDRIYQLINGCSIRQVHNFL